MSYIKTYMPVPGAHRYSCIFVDAGSNCVIGRPHAYVQLLSILFEDVSMGEMYHG